MKVRIVIISAIFLIASCQNKETKKRSNIQVTEVKSEGLTSEINDTLDYVTQITRESIRDTVIDVLQYFKEDELPGLYRLGGVAYQPYSLNGKLAKVDLDFEGDRETLRKSYYFNEQGEIFYIVRTYSTFEPPKWEEGSKETSIKKSAYYIFNGEVSKSIGDTVGVSKIEDDIERVKELIESFK